MDKQTLERKLKFIDEYNLASNAATGSQFDSNANVASKNLATQECELGKKDFIDLNRAFMRRYLTKLYDEDIANQYERDLKNHIIYTHDESSLKPYTYSSKEVINAKYKGQLLLLSFEQLYELIDLPETLLDEEEDVWAKYPKNLEILDKDDWTSVTRLIRKRRHRDLVRVKTSFGEDLIVTDNHPLIVSEDREKTVEAKDGLGYQQFKLQHHLEWHEHTNLELDTICDKFVLDRFDNYFTSQTKDCGKYYISPNNLSLTEELGYFVGFFIGDGAYDTSNDFKIQITQKERSTLEKLSNIAIKYFNAIPVIKKKSSHDCFDLFLYSISLSTFLRDYLKIGHYAQFKTLPYNILETNKDFAKGIIWGLVDSDGTIRNGTINIRIASRTGINQLCWLLKDLDYTVGTTINEASIGIEEQVNKGYTQNYTIWGVSATVRYESQLSQYSYKAKDIKVNNKGLKYTDGWVNILDVKTLQEGHFVNDLNEYIYDITTESHSFICNNLWTHNCVAASLYPFLLDGLQGLGGSAGAPKHANSYIGSLINLIFLLSSQFAGAVAIPEFLTYFDHFLRLDYGNDYTQHLDDVVEKIGEHEFTLKHKIEDWFQQFVYSVNQPAGARNYQSPFINISYFDKYYFESIFADFFFPDFDTPCWETTKELQKMFMRWFNKEREKTTITFPVESFNLLVDKETQKYKDEESADFCAEMHSLGHSFFIYQSDSADSLSSCCRLRNGIEENVFSTSMGAGGVMTGSKKVITLNLNRIVQDWYKHFTDIKMPLSFYIKTITQRVHKYLNAWDAKLRDDLSNNMLPAYSAGFISLDKQFLTVGVNGFVEAAEFLSTIDSEYNGIKVDPDNAQYRKLSLDILGTIEKENRESRSVDGNKKNLEFVPGENASAKLYEWDKRDGYVVPQGRNLYNSYFYVVEDTTIDPVKKFYYQGHGFADVCSGGVALHNNLSEFLSKRQYRYLMDVAVKAGCNYWTYNVPATICNDCGCRDKRYLHECPKCGSHNLDYETRIIGYLRRVSNFSEARQKEAAKRAYTKLDSMC